MPKTDMTTDRLNRYLFLFCLLAGLSLYATLFLPYIGEEGVYTIRAMELARNHNYWISTLFQSPYGRPPLLIWFILPIAKLLGWQHVLVASRFVTATAAILIGWLTHRFVRKMTGNLTFANLSLAILFSGDLIFRRGWLAYADVLFSLFIIASIFALWCFLERDKYRYLFFAVLSLSAAFFTKTLNAYAFYGVTGLYFLCAHPKRLRLFHPAAIAIHLLLLLVPAALFYYFPGYLYSGINDLFTRTYAPSLWHYLRQVFFLQPAFFLIHFGPLAIWAVLRILYKHSLSLGQTAKHRAFVKGCFWIALLNFLPYWLAPREMEVRYYLPIYPFAAIFFAHFFLGDSKQLCSTWRLGKCSAERSVLWILGVVLAIKWLMGAYGFYLIEVYFRPQYARIAETTLSLTKGNPLKVYGSAATTLSVVSELDSHYMQTGHPLLREFYYTKPFQGYILLQDAKSLHIPLRRVKQFSQRTRPIGLYHTVP